MSVVFVGLVLYIKTEFDKGNVWRDPYAHVLLLPSLYFTFIWILKTKFLLILLPTSLINLKLRFIFFINKTNIHIFHFKSIWIKINYLLLKLNKLQTVHFFLTLFILILKKKKRKTKKSFLLSCISPIPNWIRKACYLIAFKYFDWILKEWG